MYGAQGQQFVGQRRQLAGPGISRRATSFLYSANKLPTAFIAGEYDYFAVGKGQIGQGFGSTTALSGTETNLLSGSRIPDQEKWQINEVGFAFSTSAVLADARLVCDNSFLKITKPDYEFLFGPAVFYPAGAGLYTATTTHVVNGWPVAGARVKLKVPVILDPGETFKFTLVCTSAQTLSAATVTYLMLWGNTAKEIVQ